MRRQTSFLQGTARAALLAVLLGLGSSCAVWRGKNAAGRKNTTPTATGAAATGQAQSGGPDSGGPVGRLISRARVDDAQVPASDNGPTPGRELIAHALAAGADTGDSAARPAANIPVAPATNTEGVPLASAERRVGVVRVIGAHGKFVLLETTLGSGEVLPKDGEELRCRGSAANGGVQTAVVKLSRERQPPFAVADVVSGTPQVGDMAYFAALGRR